MNEYDVIYIGSGHAAWHGGLILKNAGKSVLIIEKELYGGTCTNYGCNAKILLDGPYELADAVDRYEGIGKGNDFNVDWPSLMKFKKQVVSQFPQGLKALFDEAGFDIVNGKASLKDSHTVVVNGDEYYGENIVIAAGEEPVQLDVEGKEYLKDSRDFLSVDELPKNAIFVGAGIISMEFASILSQAGSKVDILVHSDKVLRRFHQPYVQKLVQKLEKMNVTFHYNENLASIVKNDGEYEVTTESGLTLTGDYVLGATGRAPNLEGLGLDEIGIEYTKNGIIVNDHMQTSVDNIYASGDVVAKDIPKLTPTAAFESNYIAMQILGNSDEIEYPVVPHVVYTLPRIATVGVTVSEAEENSDYIVTEIPYGQTAGFETKNEPDASIMLVTNTKKEIVGAELFNADADNLINFFTIFINKKITLDELKGMIFAFPGITSAVLDSINMAIQ